MKTLIFLLIGLFFSAKIALAMDIQQLNSGTTENLFDICFINASTGFVVGSYGTILKTTDNGQTWFLLNTNISNGLKSVYFIDESIGFVVGTNGVLLKTTNAGVNWTFNYPTAGLLLDVFFLNAQTGYTVGNYSACLMTTNSGVNWSYQTIPANSEFLRSVAFNMGKGFICVAGNTMMLTTTNGGVNWIDDKLKFRNGTSNLGSYDIAFSNNFGFVVGGESISTGNVRPIMFVTLDNGTSWLEKTLPQRNANLYSVVISPNDQDYLCAVGYYYNDSTYGDKGLILTTTNGGTSFQEHPWGTGDVTLYGVTATATDYFIVGSGGVILKTAIVIGVQNISSEIPESFSLAQNYPNPFNPTTNIEINVHKSENVKVIVYDINGREIETLVNQVLQPGVYKIDFNGAKLSSGTYFYRMIAGSFVETKKMVLMK